MSESIRNEVSSTGEFDLSDLDFSEDITLDVNSSSSGRLPIASLTDTTNAFNFKIQKKKKEQEVAFDEAIRLGYERHERMLVALTYMRKSLRDVTRVNLGERFRFELLADDHGGWPRITLLLKDEHLPEKEYPFLRVSAHDRHSLGVLEINISADEKAGQRVAREMLNNEQEVSAYPKLLRRNVRLYLDQIEQLILKAEDQSEQDAQSALVESLAGSAFYEDGQVAPEISTNVFSEDDPERDLFETLPVLDDMETIS